MNIKGMRSCLRLPLLGALASLTLAACVAPTAGPAPTTAPITAPQVEPSLLPTEAAGEPAAGPDRRRPVLVAVAEGMVLEMFPGSEPRELATAPAGVLAAAVSGETLVALRADEVVRVNLDDGTTTTLATLDAPARYGSVRLLADGARFVYTAVVDDSRTPFGMGTRIGVYTLGEATAPPLLSEPQVFETLGSGVENGLLYLLPRGQDPAIGRVQMRSLDDGALTTELSIEGEGYAQLDPAGRNLAVSARTVSGDPSSPGSDLPHLYDLMSADMQKQPVTLPEAPSAATSAIWSPDGKTLYFTLTRGNVYNPQGSYGLWALDPGGASPRQVSPADLGQRRISAISPDGKLLVLLPAGNEPALTVNLDDGTTTELALPPGTILAGWR